LKTGLIITDVAFWEQGAGHKSRILQLVSYLSKYTYLKVVFVGPYNKKDTLQIENYLNIKICFIEINAVLKPKQYGERLKQLISNQEIDFCIIEYLHNSYFLNYLPSHIITFLDTHDIISERTKEFRKYNYESLYSEINQEIETAIFKLFNYVILICDIDFNLAKKFVPESKLILMPHSPNMKNKTPREIVKCIGFVGSEYLPNFDALKIFIKECWPNIFSRFNVSLNIYGNVAKLFRNIPSDLQINLIGFVSQVELIYNEIDIAINPVRFGSGVKIKNIEAMANSIPLVTTLHGARGIENASNFGFLVGNGKDEFIQSLSSLIQNYDYRKIMGENAYRYVSENFSPKKCYNIILEIIYGRVNGV